jgi:hypothetical protein
MSSFWLRPVSDIIIIIIIITGMTALCEPWPSSKLFAILPYIGPPGHYFFGFLNNIVFMMGGCQPHAQPPTWRTRVSLFVWLLPLDPSSLGGPTSSYATAGIALRVSGALKPHHHDKVGTALMGSEWYAMQNTDPSSHQSGCPIWRK